MRCLRIFFEGVDGEFDFFKVINPKKYASNWFDFIGNLYTEIEDEI